ncbi:lipase secretion chaperone [Marinobacter sp. M216]|uniref:Lipase chaperone n=1 Tax=Marinobacter albus TaxID=3030833 RepID=A0ABT7H7K1_9GAMM|nr:lipase secretion chaperone [Marinobacter sp. M216]MDK9556338.1 lipase secretion chaperone [Marinobacter sp. M216]
MNAFARPLVLVPLVLIGLTAIVWLWPGTMGGETQGVITPQEPSSLIPGKAPSVQESTPPSQLVGRPRDVPVPEQMPASLAGTSVPGGWARVDAFGGLIPTLALRQMFEYYLSALGEESLSQLVARIEQTLSVLEEPARSQALETLGAYLDYKLAVSDLEAGYGDGLDALEMQRRMAEIHALRRTWLDSATAEAFFAQDEAIDRFQVEKLRIARDPELTPQQRQAALEDAEASLPESLRRARRDTRRFADYERARQELADDPVALRAWRQEAFGAETAARLETLEQEQADWTRRWQAYSTERERLMASGLAGPELQVALDRLRNQRFDERERIRAQALDSIR